MSIDRSVVEHIGALAYIAMDPAEIDAVAQKLTSVLEHVSRLQSVDTSGVELAGDVGSARDVMRDDDIRASWPPAWVLANAPARDGDSFAVQAILD